MGPTHTAEQAEDHPVFYRNSLLAAMLVLFALPASGALIGPDLSADVVLDTTYSQASDSPFLTVDFSAGYFFLENFETADAGTPITTPGVTADNGGPVSVVFGPSAHDSVDLDDGVMDGNGLAGETWFNQSGGAGVTFGFDAVALGTLPTHAGLVWTDGSGTITFEAFESVGASLGTLTGNHATAGNNGETDEDRFYGAIDLGGISAIKLSNSSGGIEVDHLQYGAIDSGAGPGPGPGPGVIPEPTTALLLLAGLAGTAGLRRRGAI